MAKPKKNRVEWVRRADKLTLQAGRLCLGTAIRDRRMATMVKFRSHGLQPMRQSELARRLGIAQKTLDNIEQGNNWPSFPLYIALCRELKLGKIPLVS